ncbi:MAG: flagellar biosynthetic protein FliR [Planctomycetota bacterium]|nr:flagellar biosynthetic protein FliR [Planctomycetota bacterium]
MVENVLNIIPVYVLVLFRIAGMMIYAPLLGSDRIPHRIKAMIASVLAMAIAPGITARVQLPSAPWDLAVAIGGEIVFGLAMGMIVAFVFIAAQWAGEIIGQQMGLNLGQTFDPQFGSQGSMIGDAYFFLCLIIFLSLNGHQAMLRGVQQSFATFPLLSVGMSHNLMNLLVGLFESATVMAMQLAAPVMVTMLVVDLILGFVGKTVPQLNIMSAGISLRSLIGLVVLIIGLGLTSSVISDALWQSMKAAYAGYTLH